jgi:hypothetical protein
MNEFERKDHDEQDSENNDRMTVDSNTKQQRDTDTNYMTNKFPKKFSGLIPPTISADVVAGCDCSNSVLQFVKCNKLSWRQHTSKKSCCNLGTTKVTSTPPCRME